MPGSTPPVRYVRSGGLAGREEVLDISPEGTVVLTRASGDRSVRSALTPAERSALAAALDRAQLPRYPQINRQPSPGYRDAFSYALTVGSVTVWFHDGSVPPGVVDLVRALQGITQRVSGYR